jgi:hypothetical protein
MFSKRRLGLVWSTDADYQTFQINPRGDSQQSIRLKARLQRADKSSVFSEWRFRQILSCWTPRQTNVLGLALISIFHGRVLCSLALRLRLNGHRAELFGRTS